MITGGEICELTDHMFRVVCMSEETGQFVYHGTHEDLSELKSRPIKGYNSVGSWFSEDPKHAQKYGPKVFKFELPQSVKWYRFAGEFETLWFDVELAQKYFTPEGKELLKRLSQHTPDLVKKDDGEWYRVLEAVFDTAEKSLDELGSDVAKAYKNKQTAKKVLMSVRRGFDNFMRENLYVNVMYLKAWRDKFEKQGYDGIFFDGVKIDTTTPVKAWLLFKPDGMKPVGQET